MLSVSGLEKTYAGRVLFSDVGFSIVRGDRIGLVGPNGAGKTTQRLARGLRLTQTGYARTYALAVLLGAVGLLVYFLFMAG
jgi:ATPase subunit of ABC transporter with duplicated ATPase domains